MECKILIWLDSLQSLIFTTRKMYCSLPASEEQNKTLMSKRNQVYTNLRKDYQYLNLEKNVYLFTITLFRFNLFLFLYLI